MPRKYEYKVMQRVRCKKKKSQDRDVAAIDI
jgi:hypothetical protein